MAVVNTLDLGMAKGTFFKKKKERKPLFSCIPEETCQPQKIWRNLLISFRRPFASVLSYSAGSALPCGKAEV